MNIPNSVTWLRVVATAPVIALLVDGSPTALWAALTIMLVSEVTDGVDGYLARRLGQVSAVGKILDPLADSLYRISVFTAFAANHWMPIWMFLIMVWRDLGVAYIRVVAEQYVGTMAARPSGKWKAVVQGAAQLLVVLAYAVYGAGQVPPTVDMVLFGALSVATAVTLYSLVDYGRAVVKALH